MDFGIMDSISGVIGGAAGGREYTVMGEEGERGERERTM
jgi:hypothetical protein